MIKTHKTGLIKLAILLLHGLLRFMRMCLWKKWTRKKKNRYCTQAQKDNTPGSKAGKAHWGHRYRSKIHRVTGREVKRRVTGTEVTYTGGKGRENALGSQEKK